MFSPSFPVIDLDKDFAADLNLFFHILLCDLFFAEDLIFFFADLVFAIVGMYNIITIDK